MTLDQRMRQASNEVHDTFNGRTGSPVAQVARRNRAVRFVVAVVATSVVTVAVGSVALNNVTQPDAPATGTVVPSVTVTSTPEQPETVFATDPDPDPVTMTYEGISAVRLDPITGDLIGIRYSAIYRSTDNGQSWAKFHGEDGRMIEVLDISAQGTIVAIENRNDTRKGELGPNSTSNESPMVHIYNPETGEWRATVLPRPELPIPDLAPAPADGTGPCDLGGLQSWVDGTAVAIGEQIVIVGGHAVNGVYVVDGEAVCSEGYQFLWVSSNGVDWTIVPNTGTDIPLSGLVWTGDSYVGYGSIDGLAPILLTSPDLSSWTQIELDLSVVPDSVIVGMSSATSQNAGLGMAGAVPYPGGTAFVFPVLSPLSRLDTSVADIDALKRLVAEERLTSPIQDATLGEILVLFEVEFPLNSDDITKLLRFYGVGYEHVGRLVVETTDATAWTTSYIQDSAPSNAPLPGPVEVYGEINLYISNQSSVDPQVDITVHFDGNELFSHTLDVGSQPTRIETRIEDRVGLHEIVAISDTGAEIRVTVEFEEGKPKYLVLNYWGSNEGGFDRDDPLFDLDISDTEPAVG